MAGERKHSSPARQNSGGQREPRSPISGGERRGPLPAGEREKALEAVRAVMQPKVCSSFMNLQIKPSVKFIEEMFLKTGLCEHPSLTLQVILNAAFFF